jgi:hypothetical protein
MLYEEAEAGGRTMKAKAKRLFLANLVSMAIQLVLLGLLCRCGFDTWLAVGISKGTSWGLFSLQLLTGK